MLSCALAAGEITLEQAKQAALAQAGFKAEDVRFTKCRMDRDDGRLVYEIEFVNGTMEYEFDVDATSGRILEYNIDGIYD